MQKGGGGAGCDQYQVELDDKARDQARTRSTHEESIVRHPLIHPSLGHSPTDLLPRSAARQKRIGSCVVVETIRVIFFTSIGRGTGQADTPFANKRNEIEFRSSRVDSNRTPSAPRERESQHQKSTPTTYDENAHVLRVNLEILAQFHRSLDSDQRGRRSRIYPPHPVHSQGMRRVQGIEIEFKVEVEADQPPRSSSRGRRTYLYTPPRSHRASSRRSCPNCPSSSWTRTRVGR